MKRFSLGAFAVLVLLAVQTLSGCGAADTADLPVSQSQLQLVAALETPVYSVPITVDGQSRTVNVRASEQLNTNLLELGFRNLTGTAAVHAALADIAQRSADDGILTATTADDVLVIDASVQKDTSGSTARTCYGCWNVYQCYCGICHYIGRACGYYSC